MKKYSMLFLCLPLLLGACTEEAKYDLSPSYDGEVVFFPAATKTSYTLDGTEGSITIVAERQETTAAVQVELQTEFLQGSASVFEIPTNISFAAGEKTSTLKLNYSELVRGTTYEFKMSIVDPTPYAVTSLTLNVLYPPEVIEEWEEVSKNAVYIDNIFSMYGAPNIRIENIKVEKEANSNKYRFQSPYDNVYFKAVRGSEPFPADFVPPYIILDGETYKEEAPDAYFINKTALGFQQVDGVGAKADATWNTFGSVAGNLSTSAGPIPPTSTSYPLGSYDKATKTFEFGATYHQLGGYGYYVNSNKFYLHLDPSLLEADFERDYTWEPVEDASGYFESELEGTDWIQTVEQAEEDETFFRLPSLYVEGAHFYFQYNEEKGTFAIPKGLPLKDRFSGYTTFGNKVYMEILGDDSTVDKETKVFNFVITFYLVDEDGNKTAELAQVTEMFIWGEPDKLVKGKAIDDYVGTWKVPVDDGEESGAIKVTITKSDSKTLLVNGLSVMEPDAFDDTFKLHYDDETGYLIFVPQSVAPFNNKGTDLPAMIALFDGSYLDAEEILIGGFTRNGILEFINDAGNEGVWDSMVYVVFIGGSPYFLSGYWNYLKWTPMASTRSVSNNFGTFDFGREAVWAPKGATRKKSLAEDLGLKASPASTGISKIAEAQSHNLH